MSFYYKASNPSYQYLLKSTPAIECQVIFSKRKSISIQIKEDGHVEVRAPFYASRRQVELFIESKRDWIIQKQQEVMARIPASRSLSPEQEKRALFLEKKFRKAARDYIPYRVEYFHALTGGHYTSVTIRDQKSRWGSCSSHGTLSFNYRLMLAPPKVLDYVVVHELCHLTHMNHSQAFWDMVECIMPDYKIYKKWLKDHGQELTIEQYMMQNTRQP